MDENNQKVSWIAQSLYEVQNFSLSELNCSWFLPLNGYNFHYNVVTFVEYRQCLLFSSGYVRV